mgnify:CR=1 FL=1
MSSAISLPPPIPIAGAEHLHSGKVRDLYRIVDGEHSGALLMVASDRISAFDYVLDSTIPDKGEILTRMSLWWFGQLADLVPNHVISTDVPEQVQGRAVICQALDMFPVECVSWENCQDFLKKCEVKGLKVKLPHEDEWEYACRGGKGNKQSFYWGNELNGDKANCDGNRPYGTETKGVYLGKPTEVGSYEKVAHHPWGLCDMHGNVSEWCDNFDSIGSTLRVLRGGHSCSSASRCDVMNRDINAPSTRSGDFGLRVCLVLN